MKKSAPLQVIRENQAIPTYGLGVPEKNPVFFEKRVYQGSCGKVYPVPFIDKVFDTPNLQNYDSVRMENDYLRLQLLPEIGGRIFLSQDKSNSDYDFFYRQDVIKPALVGLAGPWISGGVEFNWPQHHRPGTYLPTDVHIEHEADGACTVWLSEHDPINRLKGMHGIRMRPGSALIELRARLFNRTPFTQTFLWWANVAAKVHEAYQSFFPPDVNYVADHAVRAMSSFPLAHNHYYGVDYAARSGANDLSWYKNIPVPTSYMICQTGFDFFGGYDHKALGGFVHVANRHIAPGKKQWTWGDHAFGHAWDRELTDNGGPYIELMAGVYTDNQPDFSYLAPYETKTFSQFWWPFQKIGPVQNATVDAALRLVIQAHGQLDLGAVVSQKFDGARLVLRQGDTLLLDERHDLGPNNPWQNKTLKFSGVNCSSLQMSLFDNKGAELCSYRPVDQETLVRSRQLATEPPQATELKTQEERFLTAEHLEQYRHPTRSPKLYWDEILKSDPMDARTNVAYGRHLLQQGLLSEAAPCFEKAIARFTSRHPNAITGEAHYFLGLVYRWQGRYAEAYGYLYKATWDYAWRSAAYYELALLDARNQDWRKVSEHAEASLDTNRQNNKAQILKALAQRKLGLDTKAVWQELLTRDPLDHWARYESGDVEGFLSKSRNDAQTVLDLAYDYAEAGCTAEAIALLELHHTHKVSTVAVPNPLERSTLTHYVLAWLREQQCAGSGISELTLARALSPDYLFPSRLHDQTVLAWALAQPGPDRNAAYGLGNFLFDRKRHEEAIAAWEMAALADPSFSTVQRNLGIAYWNVRREGSKARSAYERAVQNAPEDARIFYEFDQLRKKLKDPLPARLLTLQSRPDLVAQRDDASVECAALYNQTGKPEQALEQLLSRRFHPWEGGEGQVLRQYTTARLLLGEAALNAGHAQKALEHFQLALHTPENLGEAYHLLQAKADVNYWCGRALQALGKKHEAAQAFAASAGEAGDFQSMAVTEHSELSYFRGLALLELGQHGEAQALFLDFRAFALQQMESPAKIDYFATSLPLLLVFEDDMNATKREQASRFLALAEVGLQKVGALAKIST